MMRRGFIARTSASLFLLLLPLPLIAATYPLTPSSICKTGADCTGMPPPLPPSCRLSCGDVIDAWNAAAWADLVDEHIGTPSLAAVRWYNTEGNCTIGNSPTGARPGCDDQLNGYLINNTQVCPNNSSANSQFCGVTDELSNVLLSHAIGSNRDRFERLRNFTELLRKDTIDDLHCWLFRVHGDATYDGPDDLCLVDDSATDADLRILHAYALACAKQRLGIWTPVSGDFCADYERQGRAVWNIGLDYHGDIKLLPNGEYYLAMGHDNWATAPTANVSYRPDYYELAPLVDLALYLGEPAMLRGVEDMLGDYLVSLGVNHVPRGWVGHFTSAATTSYVCEDQDTGPADTCAPAFINDPDGWRTIPALANLMRHAPDRVSSQVRSQVFDYWWTHYSGGHPTNFGATQLKPLEIYADATPTGPDLCPDLSDPAIRNCQSDYKTHGMWIPLAATYSQAYTMEAVDHLVNSRYDWSGNGKKFFGAAYFGAYHSQFALRAVGVATGMADPRFWTGELFHDRFESGTLGLWSAVTP